MLTLHMEIDKKSLTYQIGRGSVFPDTPAPPPAVDVDPDPLNALEVRANGLFVGPPKLSSTQW